MRKNFPDPDMGGPGTSSHVASATDFTGIAVNLAHPGQELDEIKHAASMGQDPHLEAHLTQRMKKEKKSDQM